MPTYFHGLVTCRDGKTMNVELTFDERDRLTAGELPCPCCATRCRPRFKLEDAHRPQLVSWNGHAWTDTPRPIEH